MKKIRSSLTHTPSIVGMFIDYFSFIANGINVEFYKHKRFKAIKLKRMHSKRERFLVHSKQMEKFIGKSIDFAFSKLGPAENFGSMDFGLEVGQWRRYGLVIELWFKDGRCTSSGA